MLSSPVNFAQLTENTQLRVFSVLSWLFHVSFIATNQECFAWHFRLSEFWSFAQLLIADIRTPKKDGTIWNALWCEIPGTTVYMIYSMHWVPLCFPRELLRDIQLFSFSAPEVQSKCHPFHRPTNCTWLYLKDKTQNSISSLDFSR